MFKFISKKMEEADAKRVAEEEMQQQKEMQKFLKLTCKMANENRIQDAIYTVWTDASAIIVTDDFLYFYGASYQRNTTSFHHGEALALNKLVSVQADYESGYESIRLRFADGSERYIKCFEEVRWLSDFFKKKACEQAS